MSNLTSNPVSIPQAGEAPIDPALLARMATAFFSALPNQSSGVLPSVQAPVNIAPPGSPLASPAGFGPSIPGTPIPQGQIPGTNLLPASPTQLPSLANRAPALLPHATAPNGVPDTLISTLPAYEPRLGGAALGVPQAQAAGGQQAGSSQFAQPTSSAPVDLPSNAGASSPYYFLQHGQPSLTGRAGNTPAVGNILDQLADQPFANPAGGDVQNLLSPSASNVSKTSAQGPAKPSTAPQYYFVDSVVLPSGYVTPAKPHPNGHAQGTPISNADQSRHPAFDVHAVRRDFPVLQERVNGKQLVWFDNAATTHKPQSVIDRIAYFYAHENSNIHRAAHELAARATDAYEGARLRVKNFINAPDVNEVIFVRGTTEAINLVAKSWGGQHVGEGDEIIVSNLEHHANIVPWQQLAAAKGAKLRVIPVDDSGQVLLDEYKKLLNDRTKIVAVTQVSNALGTVVPVKEIVALAQRAGAKALVDGAQSI